MVDSSLQVLLDSVRVGLPGGLNIYLVGGAVRDALLGLPTRDLDFALSGDVLAVSRKLANKLGAAYYPLDIERKTARVIWIQADGSRLKLDFSALRGPDLEGDLRGRDFTINAMALPVQGELKLIDPLNGAADLRARVLRACSPGALWDDPVRVVRGIRLAVGLQLKIISETNHLMRQAVSGLAQVSAERLRDELFHILDGPHPAGGIRLLDVFGALPFILPELEALKGVRQSPPHIEDVWNHTLGVVQRLGEVNKVLSVDFDPEKASNWSLGLISIRLGRYRAQLHEHFTTQFTPERSLYAILIMAALYHDVGKPASEEIEAGGRIRFRGHESISAQSAAERARQLHLSNSEVERVGLIVKNHMRPLFLGQANRQITRRAIYRYYRATGVAGIDVGLLSLADSLATYGPTLPQDVWSRQVDVARILWEAWWENRTQSIAPPVLLNGHDLMEAFDLSPGPAIGELLEAIREAQAIGQVENRDQALAFAGQKLAK